MTQQPRLAIYPGTFDPITIGHMDIIKRALKVVDRLVVGVADNPGKGPIFTAQQRVALIKEDIKELGEDAARIDVKAFDGLLVDFAQQQGASILIRGLRAVSDFENEFQMSSTNRRLNPAVETLFLPASERTHFVASRYVKEIARHGGETSAFVSKHVQQHLAEYFNKPMRGGPSR